MKLSKYIRFFKAKDENKSILINYLNGKICIFTNSADKLMREYFDNGKSDRTVENYLKKMGVLIDEKVDESLILKKLETNIYENKDTLSLTFILTEDCNLRCVYCCEKHSPIKMSFELQNKIIKFVEENIHRYHYLKVEWFGGEPLLCLDIIEYISKKFIDICARNKVQYYAVTSTNGYFLNSENIKKLKDLHIYVYQVTVDGLKKTHDGQRKQNSGEGSWDVIVNNLRDIRDKYTSNLISLIIRTNITIPIYDSLDEYMEFLLDEFGEDKRFSFLWRIAEDWGNIDEENKKLLCGTHEYRVAIEKATKHHLRNRYVSGTLKPGGRVCESVQKNSLIFFPSGEIGKCERDVSPEQSHIGTIDDLLNDPDELLNTALIKNDEEPNRCRSCEKFPICFGKSCPFSDNQCGYEMTDIDFLLNYIMKCDDSCNVISEL